MQDLAENFDNSAREDDSEDTRNSLAPGRGDTEGEIDAKLKDLNELLRKNVTSVLQVPEVKEDKLKVPVQLDLLSRLSFSLQELYTLVLSMGTECCKCSEEVRREFFTTSRITVSEQNTTMWCIELRIWKWHKEK